MSSAVTVTSTWPETPVSSCSASTFWSSGRSRGTSSRKSEMISVRVPAIQPATASTVAAAITRPGIAIESASERGPSARQAAAQRGAVPRDRAAGGPGRRVAEPGARDRALALAGHRQHGQPGGQRERERDRGCPTTSRIPNERTIGIGESSSTRKPAAVARQAVAITGPPRAAASAAARGGEEPRRARLGEARLQLDRVVDGQPDQHRQARDRRHRERAAEQRQHAERDRARDQADQRAGAAGAAARRRARARAPSRPARRSAGPRSRP